MASKSLYDILGCSPTATAAELRAGYRRASQANHPDAGGTEEAQQEVNRAYHILSDPVKRAKYDATGDCEHADSHRRNLEHDFLEAFIHAVKESASSNFRDPMQVMRKMLQANYEGIRTAIAREKKEINVLNRLLKRLRFKEKPDGVRNYVEEAIHLRISVHTSNMEHLNGNLTHNQEMRDECDRFEFAPEQMDGMPVSENRSPLWDRLIHDAAAYDATDWTKAG